MPEGPLERTTALIEDVEWMVENGAGWEEICRRTARKPDSLERLLRLNSRADLLTKARSTDRAYA